MQLQKNDFICATLNENYIDSVRKLIDNLDNLGIKENLHTVKLLNSCMANFTNILEKNIDFIKIANVKEKQEYITNIDNLKSSLVLCDYNHFSTMNKLPELLFSIAKELSEEKIPNDFFNVAQEDDIMQLINKNLETTKYKLIIVDIAGTFLGYNNAVLDFCQLFAEEISNISDDYFDKSHLGPYGDGDL